MPAFRDLSESSPGCYEWSGSIKRREVTREDIEEAWDGEPPDKSVFEEVKGGDEQRGKITEQKTAG